MTAMGLLNGRDCTQQYSTLILSNICLKISLTISLFTIHSKRCFMNSTNMKHIFLSVTLMTAVTICPASDNKNFTKIDPTLIGLGAFAGGVMTTLLTSIGVDYYKQWTHEKDVKKIENVLKKNEENNDAFSIGVLDEMLKQIKTSERFVGSEGKESICYSEVELLRRINLLDKANVRKRLSQITDEREAQAYTRSLPEQMRVEVEPDIKELNQRLLEADIKKNDEKVQDKLHALVRQFKYQQSASKSELKDAIQGDFGQSITRITEFCETVQYEIKQLESLSDMNLSPTVKKDIQVTRDTLITLVRNTHVWLETEINHERVKQQEHERIQIQLEVDRAKKEYQLKKSKFITDAQAQLGKLISDLQREATEVSTRALQTAAVLGSQVNVMDEKIARRFSDFTTNISTRFDALRKAQQEHHEETQVKLTEVQRVNLSNADMLNKTMATVGRIEAQYRFDVQHRYSQQPPQFQYPEPGPSAPQE